MFVWVIKTLQYERIDISEGIDSKDIGYKFESNVCNKSHDVLMTAYGLKNIAILNVKGVDYGCILWGNNRNEAVNFLNNSLLEDKGVL